MREEGGGLVFACAFYLRVYTFLPLPPRVVACPFGLLGADQPNFNSSCSKIERVGETLDNCRVRYNYFVLMVLLRCQRTSRLRRSHCLRSRERCSAASEPGQYPGRVVTSPLCAGSLSQSFTLYCVRLHLYENVLVALI